MLSSDDIDFSAIAFIGGSSTVTAMNAATAPNGEVFVLGSGASPTVTGFIKSGFAGDAVDLSSVLGAATALPGSTSAFFGTSGVSLAVSGTISNPNSTATLTINSGALGAATTTSIALTLASGSWGGSGTGFGSAEAQVYNLLLKG